MLKLNNVTVSFEDDIILEDINLNIKKGEVVSIIGPSGSGKSTLVRTMNHMVIPSKGDVYFKDEKLNEKNINSYCCFLFNILLQYVFFFISSDFLFFC